MAGDWMKVELELPDKPEVHYIAGALNLDPDAVVGKLLRVWAWFDKHTEDGNAYGVTYALADRISGVSGFGEAMAFAGWLEQRDKTLVMPKFDRHTSESAKKRALTAKRVAEHKAKGNAKTNAKVTQGALVNALPREEKRRSNTPLPPQGGKFDDFWQLWPKCDRKQDRGKCARFWQDNQLDDAANAILADVTTKKATRKWREGYIEAPLVYLRGRRWEDGAGTGDDVEDHLRSMGLHMEA